MFHSVLFRDAMTNASEKCMRCENLPGCTIFYYYLSILLKPGSICVVGILNNKRVWLHSTVDRGDDIIEIDAFQCYKTMEINIICGIFVSSKTVTNAD